MKSASRVAGISRTNAEANSSLAGFAMNSRGDAITTAATRAVEPNSFGPAFTIFTDAEKYRVSAECAE